MVFFVSTTLNEDRNGLRQSDLLRRNWYCHLRPQQSHLALVHFHNTLHVPALQSNLISVLTLTKSQGMKVLIQGDTMTFRNVKSGKMLFSARAIRDLPFLEGNVMVSHDNEKANLSRAPAISGELLHRRFCHASFDRLQQMIDGQMVRDLPKGLDKIAKPSELCNPCMKGKMTRLRFPKKATLEAKSPGDLIVTDLKGPIEPSKEGHRYWATYIDVASAYPMVYGLKKKSE